MTAEDFVVQNGGDGETVEAIREGLPQFDGETTLALVVEAVDSVGGGGSGGGDQMIDIIVKRGKC